MNSVKTKVCKQCKARKKIERFRVCNGYTRHVCKDCCKINSKIADDKWREAHAAELKEYYKDWRKQNKEHVRTYGKTYREAHPELRASSKKWREENSEHALEYHRKWCAENKERNTNYHKKSKGTSRENLGDQYVKRRLKEAILNRTGIKLTGEIPIYLIEAKRIQIKHKRDIRNEKH